MDDMTIGQAHDFAYAMSQAGFAKYKDVISSSYKYRVYFEAWMDLDCPVSEDDEGWDDWISTEEAEEEEE